MNLNPRKINEVYNISAGTLLVMFATAIMLIMIAGMGYSQPQDPVLGISIRVLSGILAVVCLFVAYLCFFSQNNRFPLLAVIWLTVNFYIYLFGLHSAGCNTLAGFFGDSIYCFGISPRTTNILVIGGAIYLSLGSCITCLMVARFKPVVETTLKMSCPDCGGRIKFEDRDAGKSITCPHCEGSIALRKPGDLVRTACFFCKKHIEFPAHALGRKISCPHCKMGITLKESV